MMKSSRHTQIRELVNENGQITVVELNTLLNVSEATIRSEYFNYSTASYWPNAGLCMG